MNVSSLDRLNGGEKFENYQFTILWWSLLTFCPN